jgi:hypothetical protein
MSAANEAKSVAENFQSQMEAMIAESEERILSSIVGLPAATRDSLGGVIVGANLNVDENGRISVRDIGQGMTSAQQASLVNLSNLAYYCFDTEFDASGTLKDNARVKRSALPLAGTTVTGIVMVDDDTIKVDAEGRISSPVYVLPVASGEALGGVMVGTNVVMSEDGVLDVPEATSESLGVVRPDGVTITIDDGVLTASGGGGGGGGYVLPKAASNQLGGIKVGDGLSIDSSGVLSIDTGVADWMVF